jgi:hypothetical protein
MEDVTMKTRIDIVKADGAGNQLKTSMLGERVRAAFAAGRRHCGFRKFLSISLAASLLFMAGCDDDDDYDHSPPDGQGSIIIDNNGPDDLHVYIDGIYVDDVRDGHWKAFDHAPGVSRVVLDESGSDRTFRGDVDVLGGQLTVLYVTPDVFDNDLDVTISFE